MLDELPAERVGLGGRHEIIAFAIPSKAPARRFFWRYAAFGCLRVVTEALPIFRIIRFDQFGELIEQRALRGTACVGALRGIRRGDPGRSGLSVISLAAPAPAYARTREPRNGTTRPDAARHPDLASIFG